MSVKRSTLNGKKEKDGDLATTYAHCSPLSIELWSLIGNEGLKTQDNQVLWKWMRQIGSIYFDNEIRVW